MMPFFMDLMNFIPWLLWLYAFLHVANMKMVFNKNINRNSATEWIGCAKKKSPAIEWTKKYVHSAPCSRLEIIRHNFCHPHAFLLIKLSAVDIEVGLSFSILRQSHYIVAVRLFDISHFLLTYLILFPRNTSLIVCSSAPWLVWAQETLILIFAKFYKPPTYLNTTSDKWFKKP